MKRLLVVLATVASGALIWGGYVVGRDHGGVHCSGIYVSPDAVAVMHRGAALPAGYGPALNGRPVQAGCLTLHGAASPTKTSDAGKTLPPAFTVHFAKLHSGVIPSTTIRLSTANTTSTNRPMRRPLEAL